jgi:hypothetical protein
MPTFLRKITAWSVILLILVGALIVIYRAWAAIAMGEALTLDPVVSAVVVGDSRARCSVDDRGLPWLRNFGSSAESPVISYWKLHHLLKRNPQKIRTVLFFVSPHSVRSDEEHARHTLPHLFEAKLTRDNLGRLLPAEALRTFSLTWQRRLYLWLKDDIGVPLGVYQSSRFRMGGFDAAVWGPRVDSLPAPPPATTQPMPMLAVDESPLIIEHIRRLVQVASTHGAEVYLVNSPVRPTAGGKQSISTQNGPYHSLMTELARAPHATFLDLRHYPLAPDSFRNASHLNPKGAGIFTRHLVELTGAPPPREGSRERASVASIQVPGPRTYAVGAAALLCCCLLPFMRRSVPASSAHSGVR